MSRKLLLQLFALVACLLCSMSAAAAEAYACYTSSDHTLTFYYDNLRSSRSGTTYSMNTGENEPGWLSDDASSRVTYVLFDPSFANYRPTSTAHWFSYMRALTHIEGINYLNTSQVTNMRNMFCFCVALTSIDVSGFNTSNVTDMRYMFYRDNNLHTIYAGSGWSTASVTTSTEMFIGCTELVGGNGTSYDENHVDKAYARIDGGPSNPGYLTAKIEAYACYTSSDHTLTFYYDNVRSSRSGTTYDLNDASHYPGWYSDGTYVNVTEVYFHTSFKNARPTSTRAWFRNMTNLTTMYHLSYLNTENVTTMLAMFEGCSGMTFLDVYEFNTANVTIMTDMFKGCSGLTSLDLSSFNTANVMAMPNMFYGCSGLTSLDLSNFNTSKVISMNFMFSGCTNLKTIYAGTGWTTDSVTMSTNMFSNCTKLVGGMGTTFSSSHIDATYAHIDGGPSNPGYFTEWKEAYACYTSGNTRLTFYYDGLRSSRPGTTYDLERTYGNTDWYIDGIYANVTRVVFDPSFADARPTETYEWFRDMTNLTSITGLSYLNTENVTTMDYMFHGCSGLTSLDLSSFNTANVTDMGGMFSGCTGLTSLDLSSFNTANVTDMFNLFGGCSSLTSLDLSSFNTAKVTSTGYMFKDCTGLTSLDLSNFNTAKVTSMMYMFNGCTHLTTIYAGSGWTTNAVAVTQSSNMFSNCTSLVGGMGTTYTDYPTDKTYARIDGGPSNPGYFTSKAEAYACYTPSNTALTFYYDTQRSSRPGTTYDLNDVNHYSGWYSAGTNANVTKVVFNSSFAGARPITTRTWFLGMSNLTSITGLSYLNTENVTDMWAMFKGCSGLTSLDVSHFNTANVTVMTEMFFGCTGLTSLDVTCFNTAKVTNMMSMFNGCTGLTSLDLSNFNTSKVKYMNYMFKGCSNLETIYAGSGWTTDALTQSGDMFLNCTSLVGGMGTTYNSSHVNATYAHIDGGTSNPGYFTAPPVAYACYTPSNTTLTFYYDTQRSSRSGTTYDLNDGSSVPDWKTDGTSANVTKVVFNPSFANARPISARAWFSTMTNLTSITGISYLNTENMTNMSAMFYGCTGLTSLDVSHFNTSKVVTTTSMFNGCTGLTSLDLSSFNTSKVATMNLMFKGCSNLETIYAGSEWTTNAVTTSSDMFLNCTSLVGGMGTTYSSSHTDATYAHIDGGTSNPGYFTAQGLRGDVNGDGSVTIIDVTVLIDYLLTGNSSGIDMSAADVNQDSDVTIIDVTALIDYLLTGSW